MSLLCFNCNFASRKCVLISISFFILTNIVFFISYTGYENPINLVEIARSSDNVIRTWVNSGIFHSNNINHWNYDRFISDFDSALQEDSLSGNFIQLIDYFMWTNSSSCQLTHDFGGIMMENPSGLDGQKAVCIDPMVAPEPNKCLVYSFGIKNEWSFDEEMELYGCEVFSFDPSMKMEHHDHSHGIHFYNWGLSDVEKYDANLNWTLRSLSSIYGTLSARHGLKIIDYLKIDIEFLEWIALPQIIQSGMLLNVRQLGVEIHLDSKEGIGQLRNWAKQLRLIERMGMIRFDSKRNPWYVGNIKNLGLYISLGYEIAWYNSKLIKN